MQNVYMGLDVEEFIFGEGTTYEESYSNVTDEEMNEFGVIECVEDPDVACYRIALENEQNHNAIMMALMQNEMNVLESTGSVMIYEASKIKNIWEKVKQQIQSFWSKVQGVIKKVIDKLSTVVLSNKEFVKRFRGSDISVPSGMNFQGYNFTGNNVKYSDAVSVCRDMATKKTTDSLAERIVESKVNLVRGSLIGKNTEIKPESFGDSLKEYLYGSANTTSVKVTWSELLNQLESASESRKWAKKAHSEAHKAVKGLLSEVKKEQSEARKDEDDAALKLAKKKMEVISKSLTVMSTALSAETSAIMAMATQNRKIANELVRASHKKGNKDSGDIDILKDIKLV